jgi:heptosyltransferase-2
VHDILVLRPDGVGDVVMTGPFLRELRRARPHARITLIVAPRALNLVQRCPHVDRVLTVQIPPPTAVVDTWWRPLARRTAAFSLARRDLWPRSYDLAVVPRWGVDHHEASVLAYLSGATHRVGYSEHVSADKERRNRGYDRFFSQVVDDRSVKHEVERNLALLSLLRVEPSNDKLETWVSEEDEDFADEILASLGNEPYVAVGPGAGSPNRRWPIERFVELGRSLTDQGARLVAVGGPGEEALGDELQRRVGGKVVNLIGKTTLRQSAAVLKRCLLFCGNDTGPMHLAAAAGIPVVEVSCHSDRGDVLHISSPMRFGPWRVPHRIVRPKEPADGCTNGCRARVPHCILKVEVDSVNSAMTSLLEEVLASRADGVGNARFRHRGKSLGAHEEK